MDKHGVRRIELAQQIMGLARARGWENGQHLTELGLAELLEVSRSPVRAALKLLEERGVVSSRPYQGYFLNADADDLLDVNMDVPPTAVENLYLKIIDARLKGKLEDPITQADLIRHFDAPRNLVERAISRMTDEGLIERRKGRGWSFLPAFDSTQSWEHSYQLRLVMEPSSILLPQFKVDHEALTRARIAHQDLLKRSEKESVRPHWIYGIDSDFHEMVASFSNNSFFLQAIQHQNRLRRLLEIRGYSHRRRIKDWCREHLAIIDALERGQISKASDLMRAHLEKANDSSMSPESDDGTSQTE
ncbi:MAG: GntR family transcriptional regulator [Rhodospirillales bacterium]|nr:GntR family transcriptional regulator [Rhodospirillales bacterium]